jgi:hypothetical protein
MNVAFSSDWSGPPFWFTLLPALPVLLLGIPWLVGVVFVLKGEEPPMPNRAAQLYGYTVCLVALIMGLLSISSILDAAFERAHPLQSEMGFGTALTSFEAYKATYRREQQMFDRDGAARPDTASEATRRQRYDALVADRIAGTQYRTAKTLTTSSILLLISFGLFAFHWRWVRRLNGARATA